MTSLGGTSLAALAALGTRETVVPRSPLPRRCRLALVFSLGAAWFVSALVQACPFCTAVAPTLSQTRETAAIVALVEPLTAEPAAGGKAGVRRFQVHRLLKGQLPGAAGVLTLAGQMGAPSKGLVLAFASAASLPHDDRKDVPAADTWTLVPVSELGYSYFAHAPDLRMESTDRLRYFARFLESSDPLVAEDAYLEFGHAPYDEVARVADQLPMDRLRLWVADPQVPERRKGFYGLALGLAADPRERQLNLAVLEKLIAAPPPSQRAGADFRSGFDGLLGGYLMLAGRAGLENLTARFLADPRAAEGDLRHAVTALRFYHEYGREIPPAELSAALRLVLQRPQLADQAITDLARWGDWDVLGQVAALYDRPAAGTASLRRAVVGYLLACPRRDAAAALERLRAMDPQGVAEAEQVLRDFQGTPRSGASNDAR